MSVGIETVTCAVVKQASPHKVAVAGGRGNDGDQWVAHQCRS